MTMVRHKHEDFQFRPKNEAERKTICILPLA